MQTQEEHANLHTHSYLSSGTGAVRQQCYPLHDYTTFNPAFHCMNTISCKIQPWMNPLLCTPISGQRASGLLYTFLIDHSTNSCWFIFFLSSLQGQISDLLLLLAIISPLVHAAFFQLPIIQCSGFYSHAKQRKTMLLKIGVYWTCDTLPLSDVNGIHSYIFSNSLSWTGSLWFKLSP